MINVIFIAYNCVYSHMRILTLFILLFVSQVMYCHVQGIPFRKFSLDNGLPSNRVYSFTQDRDGYIWVSTEGGVVKYNGYSFKEMVCPAATYGRCRKINMAESGCIAMQTNWVISKTISTIKSITILPSFLSRVTWLR